MNALRILIVDDDDSIRWVVQRALQKAGHQTFIAIDAVSARQTLNEQTVDLVLSDIRMPGEDGLSLLRDLKQRYGMPVILMTAHADMQTAVNSFAEGAFEFLAKPFDLDELLALVDKAAQARPANNAVNAPASNAEPAQKIIGVSAAMQPVFRAIGKLARSSFNVLLIGESGSGKELVARALHAHSPRAHKAFIALNMAAIPQDLIEAELFGHEKGAFTGAGARQLGKFEQADGGTLFLDEIGDMPLSAQTRLLRVLSDGGYYRVGGAQMLQANVRIIAATHQDLKQKVEQGMFREDLFHRLNVVRIDLPPLRERREDIAELMQVFLQRAADEAQLPCKRLHADLLAALQRYRWPGNVRQLENLCRYLTVMAPGEYLHLADLPSDMDLSDLSKIDVHSALDSDADPAHTSDAETSEVWRTALRAQAQAAARAGNADSVQQLLKEVEAMVVLNVLSACQGHKQESARLLGWGRNTLTRYLQKAGVDSEGEVH